MTTNDQDPKHAAPAVDGTALDEPTASYEPFSEISKTLLERARGTKQRRGARSTAAGDGQPHGVDIHVGAQLKKLRGRRGLSQQSLADRLGLTFQQIQKYEGGKNRLSASRMYEICRFLDAEPSYFFDGINPKLDAAIAGASQSGTIHEEPGFYQPEEDIMAKTESIRMMNAFYSIPDPAVRLALRMLVNKVAKSFGSEQVDDE